MKITEKMRLACKEFKRVSSLTGTSMLLALNVIVNQVTTIKLTPFLTVGLSFFTVGICGMLYGPLLAGMSGVIADLIKYMLKPNGPFFIGFTFNEFLAGFIYGLYLYKSKVTLLRVAAARITVVLVINLFFNPLWLSIMYGKAFWVMVSARLVKNALMLPVEIALLYAVAKWVEVFREKNMKV